MVRSQGAAAVAEYKKVGGGYVGDKHDDDSLDQWTEEDCGTRSGKKSEDAGEPTKADLMAEARARDIKGRSEMTKAELSKAFGK